MRRFPRPSSPRAVRGSRRPAWQHKLLQGLGLCCCAAAVLVVWQILGALLTSHSASASRPASEGGRVLKGGSLDLHIAAEQLSDLQSAAEQLSGLTGEGSLWTSIRAALGVSLTEELQEEEDDEEVVQAAASNMRKHLHALQAHLAAAGSVLVCRPEPHLMATIDQERADYRQHEQQQEQQQQVMNASNLGSGLSAERFSTVLLTANLHNSGPVMPNLMWQILRLAAMLPQGSLHISIYESGSSDATQQWLELLATLLSTLGIQHNITSGGNLVRTLDIGRIAFLAQLRNAALSPLFSGGSGAGHSQEAASAKAGAQFDTVLFVNDVYFCAEGALRLLRHVPAAADIACGLDFDAIYADLPSDAKEAAMLTHLVTHWRLPQFAAAFAARRTLLTRLWRKFYRKAPSLLHLLPPLFYDTWVARDRVGGRITRAPPYSADPWSAARLHDGRPVPALSCWNGMVALRAAPFLTHNLRFRDAQVTAGECAASECSLVCDDFRRLGYSRILMDPNVRVGYHASAARAAMGLRPGDDGWSHGCGGGASDQPYSSQAMDLNSDTRRGSASLSAATKTSRYLSGLDGDGRHQQSRAGKAGNSRDGLSKVTVLEHAADVLSASGPDSLCFRVWEPGIVTEAAAVQTSQGQELAQSQRTMQCCELRTGKEQVDFTTDCHVYDALRVNYTATRSVASIADLLIRD